MQPSLPSCCSFPPGHSLGGVPGYCWRCCWSFGRSARTPSTASTLTSYATARTGRFTRSSRGRTECSCWVLATGFLGLAVVAGLDAFRWRVLPRPSPLVASLGLALFALGWGIKSLALRANAFAVAVVRLQRERAHTVADSGLYGVVRHPFYAADPLILVGLGLWLESYVAVLCAVVPTALMVIRLRLEERFLRREMPGYPAYAERVRHRLIPGVW